MPANTIDQAPGGFNVSDFISNLNFDGARPSLFNIQMNFPPGVPAVGDRMQFMARSASLPMVSIGVVNVPYFGREIKVMGNKRFDNWTITIINDEDFLIRDAFETWSNSINSHVGNLLSDQYDNVANYGMDMTIYQYDKAGNGIKEYTMKYAWPSSISEIQTSWDLVNVIETFTVTLEYQWWEAVTTDSA